MSEQVKEAQAKISSLIAWFKTAKTPSKPFQLNDWTVVENAKQYVETLIARVESLNVYSVTVQASYWSLQDLKKYLESQKQ